VPNASCPTGCGKSLVEAFVTVWRLLDSGTTQIDVGSATFACIISCVIFSGRFYAVCSTTESCSRLRHFSAAPLIDAFLSRMDLRSAIIRPTMPLTPGTKLDGYEVLAFLGAGGMGEVYRARDSALKREVAIKVLPSFVSHDPDRLSRFQQEAQAAAALNHPNILAIHQFGRFDGSPYLVSELLEGSTLRQLLQRSPLPVRKAIDSGVQIAHGLAAAHEKGIIHRDLKPENLFVTKDVHVKILDFGLAKLMHREPAPDGTAATVTHDTDPGMVMGTAGYMAPEQVRGKPADHRADIFAFGAILYEMLSGKRAFQRSTSAEMMTAILNDDPPAISQTGASIPPALQRVVNRCLEKNPEQRFHSASDLAFALDALSDTGTNSIAPKAQSSGRLAWRWFAASGIAVAALAAVVVWWSAPPSTPFVEEVTQLTNDGQPKNGTVVTDGSRVYFNEGPIGSTKIAQVSVTGGATVSVETPFANSSLVGIAPDSSSLLVLGHSSAGGKNNLWSVPVPGGEPHRLGVEQRVDDATYFPDERVLFAAGSGLYVADSDGGKPRRIISQDAYIWSPAVSPDGTHITFAVSSISGNSDLFQSASDGTALHSIAKYSEGTSSCCAVWSPDGRSLIFQRQRQFNADLWWIPVEGRWLRRSQGAIRLTNGEPSWAQTETAAVSRDGREIFAIGAKWRGELVRYDMKAQMFVPFLSGLSAVNPIFSPDGKWVAWESFPDHAMWRSRIDGSDRMQLTRPPIYATWDEISPDGKRVVFATSDYQIYLVACRREFVTTDAVRRVGVLPVDRLSIG
jgi:serine/threonine protein kinase